MPVKRAAVLLLVAHLAGCLGGESPTSEGPAPTDSPTGLLPLAAYAACNVRYTDGAPAPCEDASTPIAALDAPGREWVCLSETEAAPWTFNTYRHPSGQYALRYRNADGIQASVALVTLNDHIPQTQDAEKSIWRIDNPPANGFIPLPGADTQWSAAIDLHTIRVETDHENLREAEFHVLWTKYEQAPWAIYRLDATMESYYFDPMVRGEGGAPSFVSTRSFQGPDFHVAFPHVKNTGFIAGLFPVPGHIC